MIIPRVDTAIDCGTYVNPERIRSQIEGAAIMGISLAKYGEITFKNGRVEQGNFDDYPVARVDEAPTVTNVYIMPPGAETPPSGVGRARSAAGGTRAGQRDLRRHRPALAGHADRSATRHGRLRAEAARRGAARTGLPGLNGALGGCPGADGDDRLAATLAEGAADEQRGRRQGEQRRQVVYLAPSPSGERGTRAALFPIW